MPNSQSLSAHPRPVVLTGFDLEINCHACQTRQALPDPSGTLLGRIGEHVTLHGLPGAYRLSYCVQCWHCGEWLEGGLTIRSRAAPATVPGYGAG